MKIKAAKVEYIESGTYVGGEEDYYMTFRVDDNPDRDCLPRPKGFIVITTDSAKELEKMGIEFTYFKG
jgi:hypothetical protein